MSKQEKIAKFIRVLTVPPLLVTIMLFTLYQECPALFRGIGDLLMSIIWLGICPVLAYPLQKLLPVWKEKGRSGQRNLAFICSLLGYSAAVIYGKISGVNSGLQFIYDTYACSVVLLIFLNKVCKRRASGHACSITGPLIFLIYFISWKMAFVCILIGAGSFWASLKLKRHLPMDLLLGSTACLVSFLIIFFTGI